MRRFFVAGNWKMNKTIAEAQALMEAMLPQLAGIDNVDIGVAPPYLALPAMVERCRGGPFGSKLCRMRKQCISKCRKQQRFRSIIFRSIIFRRRQLRIGFR